MRRKHLRRLDCPMSRLIGLIGKAGSGKTTAADALVHFGYQRVKMAGPLKNMLKSLGLTDAHIEGELKEQPCDILGGKTPRFAMQTLGTEWGRDIIGPNLWTSAWRHRVSQILAVGGCVVCDDIRFDNEAETIREMSGAIIRVTRPDLALSVEPHASELEMDSIGYTTEVINDGTIDELHSNITDYALLVEHIFRSGK